MSQLLISHTPFKGALRLALGPIVLDRIELGDHWPDEVNVMGRSGLDVFIRKWQVIFHELGVP